MDTMIKAATRKGRITPAMRARAREIARMWAGETCPTCGGPVFHRGRLAVTCPDAI